MSHLFVQMLVIIAASRLMGGAFTKLGQPAVVGEILRALSCPRSETSVTNSVSVWKTSTRSFSFPLFFAFTGLRTQVGLLDDLQGWLICLAIIAVATIGKLGGSAVVARMTGMGWSDSLQLGALMNTRGMMELIALDIGYDLGILSPRIFTMLVIMALVTTAMTGPLLTLFGRKQKTTGRALPASP